MISVETVQFFAARVTFCAGILLFLLLAALTFLSSEARLPRLEKLPRNKWIGLFGGWIALALCVPHAAVVAPAFLLPWLWPIVLIVPILGFFSVDYPCARALGGLLILLGYYMVHFTFEFRTPGAPLLAVAGWLAGIAGIWISGKPCAMRDYLRLCAAGKVFRLSFGAFWAAEVLLALWALVMTGRS